MKIWRKLNGIFGEIYEISNTGKIRSIDWYDSWNRFRKGKELKYALDKGGYPRLKLTRKNISKSERIHRLVAIAFIPNPNNLPQVNHKDGNKQNNCVDNLEWCDNSHNQKHAIDKGLKVTKKGKHSSRFKSSVLVYDLNGNLIDELFGNVDMKRKGYDFRNVSAVVNGKRKTYKKLIFKRNEKNKSNMC